MATDKARSARTAAQNPSGLGIRRFCGGEHLVPRRRSAILSREPGSYLGRSTSDII